MSRPLSEINKSVPSDLMWAAGAVKQGAKNEVRHTKAARKLRKMTPAQLAATNADRARFGLPPHQVRKSVPSVMRLTSSNLPAIRARSARTRRLRTPIDSDQTMRDIAASTRQDAAFNGRMGNVERGRQDKAAYRAALSQIRPS